MDKDIKIFAKTIEQSALDQINTLLGTGIFDGSKIRIMPDCHSGAGCVIGFTAELKDKVVPCLIGVDIGCSIRVIELPERPDSKLLQDIIVNYIPSGQKVREDWINVKPSYRKYRKLTSDLVEKLYCKDQLRNIGRLADSVGSLGQGNHYLEVDYSEKFDKYYLTIHTGSRNLGKQVAEYYQNLAIKIHSGNTKEDLKKEQEQLVKDYKAQGRERELKGAIKRLKEEFKKRCPDIPKDLCWLEGGDLENYLHDMKLCQEFAVLNRELIGLIITDKLKMTPGETFETVHNYINFKDRIMRKGAISCREGEKVIIPMNMRDGSLICIGKGNPDWNFSGPHGAGRLMSRTAAKQNLSLEEFKASMTGIDTWSVSESTIDEAPQAYKPMEEIIEQVKDTVDIIDIIKPVYNFKASE